MASMVSAQFSLTIPPLDFQSWCQLSLVNAKFPRKNCELTNMLNLCEATVDIVLDLIEQFLIQCCISRQFVQGYAV